RYDGPRLAFVSEPDIVLIPGTRVYYIDDYDYDLYRFGGYWYYYYGGGWYRAADYDGPFYFISYTSVPYSIRVVPTRYRHHWTNYRGPAYSYYSDGRYFRSRPSNYTSYQGRTFQRRQPVVQRERVQREQREPVYQRERSRPRQVDERQNRGNRGGGE